MPRARGRRRDDSRDRPAQPAAQRTDRRTCGPQGRAGAGVLALAVELRTAPCPDFANSSGVRTGFTAIQSINRRGRQMAGLGSASDAVRRFSAGALALAIIVGAHGASRAQAPAGSTPPPVTFAAQ